MKTYLLLITTIMFFSSCNIKNAQSSKDKCEFTGVVKDYRNLDGCEFIIVTDAGEELYPVNGMDGFRFEDQQIIKFNYTELDDIMTICMKGSKVIGLTCIQEVGKVKEELQTKVCVPVNSPFAVEWMKKKEIELKPVQIDRYEYKDGYGYHFICKRDEFFFDCEGNKVCEGCEESSRKGVPSCEMIKRLKGKFTISVMNN